MSGFLLDTNVLSELIKRAPNEKVAGWMRSIDESLLYVSVLSLGEIRKGVERSPQGEKRTRLESWLAMELTDRFEGRILPIDRSISERWGRLNAHLTRTLPVIDSLLAATALHHDCTLVTRNISDFSGAHVNLFNPWT